MVSKERVYTLNDRVGFKTWFSNGATRLAENFTALMLLSRLSLYIDQLKNRVLHYSTEPVYEVDETARIQGST